MADLLINMMKRVVLVDSIANVHYKDSDTMIVDNNILSNFSKDEEYLARRCRDFLNSLSEKTVSGKSVLEWFRYRNISLWWFAYRRIWPTIVECIRFIENFRKMLEELTPTVVLVEGFYDKIGLIKQICASLNIRVVLPFRTIKKIILMYAYKRAFWRIGLHRFNRRIKRKEFKRIALAEAVSRAELKMNSVKNCVIYLAGGNYRKEIYDVTQGKIKPGEHIVQNVLDKIKSYKNLLCIDVDYYYSSDSSGLEERLRDNDQYWIPFEILITDEIRQGCESAIKSVNDSVLELFKENDFQSILTYENVKLWSTIQLVFKTLLSIIYLPNYILSIESAKHLLDKIRPVSVFLPYESGIYAMAFIVAADELGIKTHGIQHGIIHNAHFDYSMNNLKSTTSMGSPIPTLLLLFGEFYRKVLVEIFSYPDDRVKVVGNPQYENLSTSSPLILQRDQIFQSLSLDPYKSIILVTTSMHQTKYGREDYDVLIVESLAESFSGRKDIQVIVKVHPAEDITAYSNVIAKFNASNFRLVEEFPIQPLIAVCDIIVSVLSTTIIEGMVMNKPVVIAQASEKIHRDLMSIGESGAVIRASFVDLPKTVLEVLENDKLKALLATNSTKIVKYHFNMPSKGISEKIAEILTQD
jgi:hypothetical protein